MDYQITKAELNKLCRRFRVISSQLIRTAHEDGISNLRKFIKFIESNPLIYDFIIKNQTSEYDISSLFNGSGCGRYEIPDTTEEEISFTYQLLKYGLEQFPGYYYFPLQVGGYGGSKIQTQVDEFNRTVVSSFYSQIEGYLNDLLFDLGNDEQSTIHIKIENLYGEILSQDRSITQNNDFRKATLGGGVAGRDLNSAVKNKVNTVSQYIGTNKDEILKLIRILHQELPNLDPDNQDVAIESLAALEEEVATPTKLSRFKTLLFALWSAGKDAVTFTNTLIALADRLNIQLPGEN